MKKTILLIVFSLAMCEFLFAQSPLAEINKAREIKLLESTPDDVGRILAEIRLDIFGDSYSQLDSSHYQHFYTNSANIRILYSSGNCSDKDEDWNVPEWKVTEITISPRDRIQIKDIGIDYSKFRKESLWGSIKNDYAYHNKAAGIGIFTRGDWVDSIAFLPSAKNYSQLCDKAEVKKYYSSKKWNRYSWLKKAIIDIFPSANVTALDLSQTEIRIGCDFLDAAQNKNCSDGTKKIAVDTTAVDPDNDVLTYNYYISGGKIIGQGAKVVWDLSDVKAGTYKITAAVDDGCGICGKFITKTVVVKECPDCSVK
jgi:hypothetical protein